MSKAILFFVLLVISLAGYFYTDTFFTDSTQFRIDDMDTRNSVVTFTEYAFLGLVFFGLYGILEVGFDG